MQKMNVKAYAKINLALDVLGERPDGYHEVRMIMQTVKLYDSLFIAKTKIPGITIKSNLPYLPTDENNLIYSAADKFFKHNNITEYGLSVELDKRIPIASGLAGGSADAAATLSTLNTIYDTNMTSEQLCKLGAEVGADVPFCLCGGTVLAEGIGERLTPLAPMPSCYCLIVKPNLSLSTKLVYSSLHLTEDTVHPQIDKMKSAIEEGNLSLISSYFGNVLEDVSIKNYPEIAAIKKEMLTEGALGSLMSGSGPTVFGLFSSMTLAEKAYYHFKAGNYGHHTYLTTFYRPKNK